MDIIYKCTYCGKEFNPSNYQKRQYKLGKKIFCKTGCGTAFRYNISPIELSEEELIEKINYYMMETELNYGQIAHELRNFV